MHFNIETEMNQSSNKNENNKNCSTSSTDSGVILLDNATAATATATTTTTSSHDNNSSYTNSGKTKQKQQHISIEQSVNIRPKASGKKGSPTLSVRSTTISIVSIDENDALDSSCIDSDSAVEDADAEGVHNGYTVQKLGQQISYPPNSPDLPQLNKGLTVIGQQIQPSNGVGSAGIVAEQVLNGNLGAARPTAPQIGSIALTNSTDVTFGDKHFYEGPVTIQQFLIDNRDKRKSADADGHDNPAFNAGTSPIYNGAAGKTREQAEGAGSKLCPYLPNTTSRKAIAITVIVVLLTLLLGIILAQTTSIFGMPSSTSKLGDGDDFRPNIPINSTIDDDVAAVGTLEMVSVSEWGGRPAKKPLDKLKLPVHRVIISHTASESCESKLVCSYRARIVQEFHMNGWSWDHVGYNFMVGGDGRIYVGRGWDFLGAHTLGYNVDSIGVSFIGTYNQIKPTKAQISACQLLIAEGVRLKKLVPDYKLFGHRQLAATQSPDRDNIGGGKVLRYVLRSAWLAQPPQNKLKRLTLPVSLVIVLPTNSERCTTQAECTFRVRLGQTFDIESLHYDDITYNFLIGGDGNVYEGRGWHAVGAHMKGYNDLSLSFAFIGSFKKETPSAKQLSVTKLLLAEGVQRGMITSDYRLVAASKLEPTVTAYNAEQLYASFSNWTHWT